MTKKREQQILKEHAELKERLPEGTTIEDLVEKARKRESAIKDEVLRKQVGVQIDIDLWGRFKVRASRENTSPGLLLEKLMRNYLEDKETK